MKRIQFFFIFMLVVTSITLSAQRNSNFDEVWFQYYNTSKLSTKWGLISDVGYRLKEGVFNDVSQYFIRSGMGYYISPNTRVLAGAAFFHTHEDLNTTAYEIRPHQEFVNKHKIGSWNVAHRVRIEERFSYANSKDLNATERTFNMRYRYRLLFNIPVANLSKKDPNKKASLILGDELLFSAGREAFFDFSAENRFLVGPSFKFNKDNQLVLLFHLRSVSKDIPKINADFQNLWIGYKQTFDFRKK